MSNPKIKYIRRLQADRRFRHLEKNYVVEGTRWLDELVRNGQPIQFALATNDWLQRTREDNSLSALGIPVYIVTDKVMSHVSEMEAPAGVLAVATMSRPALPDSATLLLILDRVSNPGNMGAILRTAAAAGVDGTVLGPGCVDLYNPKVVRASMGAHLRLPIITSDWPGIRELTKYKSIWAASVGGPIVYSDVDWRRPSALIIGSEASGAGPEALRLASGRISIPMQGETESLNAAVAAGIILFEAVRQRGPDREGVID